MKKRVKVALVEDDGDYRDILQMLIQKSDYQCVGAYATAEAALAGLSANLPQIILMDIKLPGLDGIVCTQMVCQRFPSVQVIILTENDQPDKVFAALRAGAVGYLLREDLTISGLTEVIEQVLKGGSPISPQIARLVVQQFQAPAEGRPGHAKLSDREEQVLQGLSDGLLYKQIADERGISLDTVRKHVRKIYEKLAVNTRTEAAMVYMNQARSRRLRETEQ